MTRSSLPEGSGISQFKAAIQRAGYNEYDRFDLATITAPLPNITIKIDNVPIEFDASDLVVAEHLTEHTRMVTIGGGTLTTMTVESPLSVGDRVIVVSTNNGQTYIILDRVGGANGN